MPFRYRYSLDSQIQLPLYRPPTTNEAGDSLIIVEGEKAVNRLRGLGFVATCGPNGAGTWQNRFSETIWLAGVVDIVIISDADLAGERHAELVASSLARLQPKVRETRPVTIRMLNLQLPAGGDVVDWLEAGGTADGLRHRIASTPLWFPGQKERERLARKRRLNAERQRRFRDRKRSDRLVASAL